MTTNTKEWLQQTIAEFENTRDDIPFGLSDDDAKILIVLKRALVSLERERIRREHAEWSDATFGNVGPVGPLKHLSKEALEAAADPSDPLEWADMQFLLWDAQRRMGISDEFITRAMIEKFEINKSRQWPEPKDGEPRLHIKEQPATVVPDEMATSDDMNLYQKSFAQGYNACRAAMLQGGQPVSQTYNLPELIEGMEVSVDVSTCDFDAGHRYFGTVTEISELYTAKNGYILLVQDAKPNFDVNGNSPVIPDGWISCSERMSNDKDYVWCWGKSYGWTECDTFEGYYDWSRNKWWAVTDDVEEPASKVTHWMPLPEPP
ncbi:DUF550 domain-containing protein [Salmonella enterica subsp. enterica]|nr:DUF550 domain-containing protein [Salmonella enterica subsp. enterica serovar Hvittingfoss]